MTGRGGMRLGIDNLARRGIAGRGVLADVARYYDRVGKSIDFTKAKSIPLDDVQATLEDEGVALQHRRHPADSDRMDKVLPVGEPGD